MAVISALAALAPAARAGMSPRRFETVGRAQGLSHLSVRALAVDRDGFLWIGTEEGLNRYDGFSMRVFRHRPGDPASLGSNRISALRVDAGGRLWVGTRGGGLALYDPELERFRSFRAVADDPASLAQDDVAALAEDGRGRLWVATTRSGVDRLEPSGDGFRFVHHRHAPEDEGSLGDDRTRALAVDRAGRLWVGTMGGLARLDDVDEPRFARFRHDEAAPGSLADDEIWALAPDRRGSLWIGSWGGGVDRLDDLDAEPARAVFRHYPRDPAAADTLPDDRVMTILEDRGGTLWFGTLGGGLAELPAAERDRPRPRFRVHAHDPSWPFPIADDGLTATLEDAAGDLWFGTASGGVSRIDRRHESVVYLRHDPEDAGSLGAESVGAVLEDSRGLLWIASGDGLDRVRPGAEGSPPEVTRFGRDDGARPLPFRGVAGIVEDRSGDLWFASIAAGLGRLPAGEALAATPRFELVGGDAADPDALPTNAVLSLLVDRRGRLWVGTYRGLHRLVRDAAGRPAGFRHFRHDAADPTSLSSDRVATLAEGADGAIWAGCYYGLNRLDPESGAVDRFVPEPGRAGALSYENVLAVHVDEQGTVWAGTHGGGLNRFDAARGAFETYGVAEGLPSETVNGVAGDGRGGLWLATARGLVRFDPRRESVAVLGLGDGLLDEDLAGVAATRDGRLLLSSGGGLTILDPRAPPRPAPPPAVVLTELRRFNEPIAVGEAGSLLPRALQHVGTVELGPRDRQFAFEFAALAFRQPERHRYRYRLEGFDRDWLASSGADRRAVYGNVPPGRYRFRVVAAGDTGTWNETGASVAVVVRPPWWKTTWARTLGLLAVVLGASGWHRARLARLRRVARRLERQVEERTAELADANRRLEHASRTDVLTGLPNRRHFLERAETERVAMRRTGRGFALALGDVDRFKSINDTFGHECGDQVLAAVAATLRDTVRERDLAARWGGEEFVLLLPETDLAGARVLTEKVRERIEALRVLCGEREIPVTITLGLTESDASDTLDAVRSRADEALYAGKHAGRNRVVVWEPGVGRSEA